MTCSEKRFNLLRPTSDASRSDTTLPWTNALSACGASRAASASGARHYGRGRGLAGFPFRLGR
eukprot:6807755-Alexandrium_andersonii.AAC.1